MGRRKHGIDVHGVVLLDKPVGLSSNQALQKVRGIFQARKAGHTGSLDPFATGMLPVCLGEASKTAAFMLEAGKRYRARARMGIATTTGDVEGQVIQNCPLPAIDHDKLAQCLKRFEGEIEQVPPMYSALKHAGKPLYEYARAGIFIERTARRVTIHDLQILGWQPPDLTFEVYCSKGTYIRTLAEDIATALGCCAHLVALRRMYVEPFEQYPMQTLEQLREASDNGSLTEFLLPVDAGLPAWPRIDLDQNQQGRFSNGQHCEVPVDDSRGENVRVYAPGGHVIGLARVSADGRLQPTRVFNLVSE